MKFNEKQIYPAVLNEYEHGKVWLKSQNSSILLMPDDILYSNEMLEFFEKNVYGKRGLKKFWEHLGTIDGL